VRSVSDLARDDETQLVAASTTVQLDAAETADALCGQVPTMERACCWHLGRDRFYIRTTQPTTTNRAISTIHASRSSTIGMIERMTPFQILNMWVDETGNADVSDRRTTSP